MASYNNAAWHQKNLESLLNQNYENFCGIYIDDCSTDDTSKLVERMLANHPRGDKISLLKNSQNMGALCNLYHAVHACDDRTIIIVLDADDWLAHDNVLQAINKAYDDPNTLMTYGQFVRHPSNIRGYCRAFPKETVHSNGYRRYMRENNVDKPGHFVPSHLRTFRAGLFKKIPHEDFLKEGAFIKVAGDMLFTFALLELAGGRYQCITDPLYIYNMSNPLCDHVVRGGQQFRTSQEILNRTPYQPITPEEARRLTSDAYEH